MSDDSRSPESAPSEGSSGDNIAGRLRSALLGAFGIRQTGSAREDIEDAIAADEAAGETLSADERAMLRAILKLGGLRVEDVMVSRSDIEAIEIDFTVAEAIATFRETGHSRLPVYRETLDEPVGMVHIRDLMGWVADRALKAPAAPDTSVPDAPTPAAPASQAPTPQGQAGPRFDFAAVDLSARLEQAGLVRSVLFVPPSMAAHVLLKRMQASRTQMALVIDEFGGTDGLVSLEDLVEIIVGEIEDEHDLEENPTLMRVAEGVYVADARTSVEDARAMIGPAFGVGGAEDVESLGGLIFAATGRIPVKGEIVPAVPGFDFEVLEADPRRIKRLRIRDRSVAHPVTRLRGRVAGDTASRV